MAEYPLLLLLCNAHGLYQIENRKCPKVKGLIYYLSDIFSLLAMAQISCIFLCQGHTHFEGTAFGD
jgi:hypothetical protein